MVRGDLKGMKPRYLRGLLTGYGVSLSVGVGFDRSSTNEEWRFYRFQRGHPDAREGLRV